MHRPRPDITKYDFTFPCAHCGYKISPRELLRVDGEHVRCPKCGKDSEYGSGGSGRVGSNPISNHGTS